MRYTNHCVNTRVTVVSYFVRANWYITMITTLLDRSITPGPVWLDSSVIRSILNTARKLAES